MADTNFTARQHLEAISKGNITEATQKWAIAQIEAIDRKNAKRKEKPSKVAEANAPIKEKIFDHLNTHRDSVFTEASLGLAVGETHNKTGALVRQLVTEGRVFQTEVKIPKVGKRKGYFIPKDNEE